MESAIGWRTCAILHSFLSLSFQNSRWQDRYCPELPGSGESFWKIESGTRISTWKISNRRTRQRTRQRTGEPDKKPTWNWTEIIRQEIKQRIGQIISQEIEKKLGQEIAQKSRQKYSQRRAGQKKMDKKAGKKEGCPIHPIFLNTQWISSALNLWYFSEKCYLS